MLGSCKCCIWTQKQDTEAEQVRQKKQTNRGYKPAIGCILLLPFHYLRVTFFKFPLAVRNNNNKLATYIEQWGRPALFFWWMVVEIYKGYVYNISCVTGVFFHVCPLVMEKVSFSKHGL